MCSPIPPAALYGGIAFFLSRFLIMIAHIILLIYELARSWDNLASSIMIVILFAVVACFIIVFLNPSNERSNLSQARIAFLSSLTQSTVMTGLLIAYALAKPRVDLLIIHSLNL